MTARPTAGETVTPDQLARVERLRDWLSVAPVRAMGFENSRADADALSALLREREALRAALEGLVSKLDEVAPHVANAFVLNAAHGMRYDGPNYAEELSAARALLTGTTARTEGK